MSTTPAVIRTERLTKRFGRLRALADLDIEVPEGSVFALIGPNGAGKSTAIKTMLNIVAPTSGAATVLGADSRRLGPKQLARIGYVSENQRLPEWMRVGAFLSYSKEFYPGWRDEDARALVEAFDLPLDRKLGALSRGMRVKAALASSLAYRPRLIVLDEPFGGLDALVREELIESVLERTPEATVFIASHDLSEIESFASHIAYIDQGRLRFTEEKDALSERFREVEITIDGPVEIPREWPANWLAPDHSAAVIRFVDSRFDRETSEAEVLRRIPRVRGITVRAMPLRSIFVALARAAKSAAPGG